MFWKDRPQSPQSFGIHANSDAPSQALINWTHLVAKHDVSR